jgi:protein kinase-like protein
LTDFGVSRFVEDESTGTESGVILGTPDYMAPEVMRDVHQATELSDQYSIGVVLYECLTLVPSIGGTLERTVLRSLDREPGGRFACIRDLADALTPRERGLRDLAAVGRVRPPERHVEAREGVAAATIGDVFVALWKGAAHLDLVQWQFDLADRLVAQRPNGILALIILLPSASPPNAVASLECVRRMRRLHGPTRRQATVAVGGGIWRMIVTGVHRSIAKHLSGREWRKVISSKMEDGIVHLLDGASDLTPTYEVLRETVVALHDALALDPPAIPEVPPRLERG